MRHDGLLASLVAAASLSMSAIGAAAFEDAQYPDLKGQWIGQRMPSCRGQPSFDPTSCWGTTQSAQLTPEYKAMFEANLADQAAGGQGTNATSTCLAPGMPMVMNAHSPMEIVVLPDTTYIRVDHIRDTRRRIFTDGREWPKEIRAGFDGYSTAIGSIPTAMGATTCWRSRRVRSRARVPTTRAAFRCIETTSP